MYDFIEEKASLNEKLRNESKSIPDLRESSEPAYVVVGKDIEEEDVLVITSDYNKKMHLIEDDQCSSLTFNAKIETLSDCELKKGTIKVVDPKVSGGKAPYTFAVDENEFQEKSTFKNLEVGEYQIKVKDAEGCIIKYHNRVTIKDLDCK